MASWYELAGLNAQEFSADGIRTFAIVEGKPNRFPVILLHGTPGASFIWESTIKAVGRERKIIAPDLPGWGRSVSKYEKTPDYTRENLMSWFRAVLIAQNIERFDLVAHADSAWIAGEFLVAEPQRVRRFAKIIPENLSSASKAKGLARLWQRKTWTAKEIRRWVGTQSGLDETGRKFMPFFDELISQSDKNPPPKILSNYFEENFGEYDKAYEAFQGAKWIVESKSFYPMLNRPLEFAEEFKEFLRD